jgi:multidrug efflux pump subunit AcrA (membrane-fusion protein)
VQVRPIIDPLADTQPHASVEEQPLDDVTEEVLLLDEGTKGPPRRKRRRRLILIATAVVVLVTGAGIGIWLATGGTTGTGLATTTQVVKATTGTMKQTVSASGTIEPASEADLSFAVSGKVTAVDVSVGQTVTVGQVLATVDTSALQASADSAQASLTSAEAKLSSDESSGASTSQILSDKASVTSAQSQLTSANTNLADASLTSTIAGTVASVSLSDGQQVTGSSSSANSSASASTTGSSAFPAAASGSSTSSSTGSTSAQIVVVSKDSFKVKATVDDTQVGQVKQGDQATINLSSSSSSSKLGGFFAAILGGNSNSQKSSTATSGSSTNYYGTVSSVGLIATSSGSVASFPVTVEVTGAPTGLYAGSSATLTITVKELSTVVEVPTGAISYSGGKAQVTVVTGGHHVTRSVTTGQVSTGDTEITSGLHSGEKVLEQVVTFQGGLSGGRSLLGSSGSSGSGGLPSGFPSGGFPGGGGRG